MIKCPYHGIPNLIDQFSATYKLYCFNRDCALIFNQSNNELISYNLIFQNNYSILSNKLERKTFIFSSNKTITLPYFINIDENTDLLQLIPRILKMKAFL